MTDDEYKAYLEETGEYIHVRKLDDGTWAGIFRFIYTWGICTELDMTGYGRRYCYTSESEAVKELDKMKSLEDVPQGWERRLPEPFFFTIVGFDGKASSIGSCLTEREVIDHANFQAARDGDYSQPFGKPSEKNLQAALNLLNSKGRVLELFNIGDEGPAFIVRAGTIGLEDEARSVVASIRHKFFRL
jgi:hypothetical protein